jgi:hypothetical protein
MPATAMRCSAGEAVTPFADFRAGGAGAPFFGGLREAGFAAGLGLGLFAMAIPPRHRLF